MPRVTVSAQFHVDLDDAGEVVGFEAGDLHAYSPEGVDDPGRIAALRERALAFVADGTGDIAPPEPTDPTPHAARPVTPPDETTDEESMPVVEAPVVVVDAAADEPPAKPRPPRG